MKNFLPAFLALLLLAAATPGLAQPSPDAMRAAIVELSGELDRCRQKLTEADTAATLLQDGLNLCSQARVAQAGVAEDFEKLIARVESGAATRREMIEKSKEIEEKLKENVELLATSTGELEESLTKVGKLLREERKKKWWFLALGAVVGILIGVPL